MIPPPVLDWLLDPAQRSPRYLTLRDLLGRPEVDPEVAAAREAIAHLPPARQILDAQYPAGYWVKPDRGYSPKYKATVWQLLTLADLGDSPFLALAARGPCGPQSQVRADGVAGKRMGVRLLFPPHRHVFVQYTVTGSVISAIASPAVRHRPRQ